MQYKLSHSAWYKRSVWSGKLNPAIRRHGRCLSEIDFRRFETDDAAAWLRSACCEAPPEGPRTLSELYAIRAGHNPVTKRKKIGFRPEKLNMDHEATRVGSFAPNGRLAG